MKHLSNRFALLIIVIISGAAVANVGAKPKETVTARVSIGDCLKSDKLLVPINRNYWRTAVRGIGGGGTSSGLRGPDKCNYSYDLLATRIDRNRVKLTLTVTTPGWSVEKAIILARGKTVDLQLQT